MRKVSSQSGETDRSLTAQPSVGQISPHKDVTGRAGGINKS